MNRKTLTAIAAVAVLGIIAIFVLRQPQKGERTTDRPDRPFAKLSAGDVDTLEVTKAGTKAVIKKEGGKYKVTAPVPYAADESVAKSAFEAVEKLDFTDLVTEQASKQAEFDVDDAKAVHLTAKKGDKVLVDVLVGKMAGSGTMMRPVGKNEVWQTSGASRYAFDKSAADWRDKSVTTFTPADAEKIDVKARDGAHVVAKKTGTKEGSEDKWEVSESTVKIDKLDNGVPSGIVSAMASWKANDFADGVKLADAGLEPPALAVTVSLKGGKSSAVLIGNKKGDDEYYVKLPDAPQVFLVKKWNADRINKRPIEFRDKTLCDIAAADLSEVSVTRGENSYTLVKNGSDWKATKPAKLELDSAKATAIASAFKDWKATSFAEEQAPKDQGLAKPSAVIVAKGKKAAACTIKVGDESKDKQSYFVQTGKAPDVYQSAKWSTDRILVKVDDLKKAGSGSLAKK
jgi:hypothetical protein